MKSYMVRNPDRSKAIVEVLPDGLAVTELSPYSEWAVNFDAIRSMTCAARRFGTPTVTFAYAGGFLHDIHTVEWRRVPAELWVLLETKTV